MMMILPHMISCTKSSSQGKSLVYTGEDRQVVNMVAAKIKVVDPVDMVEPWVEAEVEVVEAVVDGDVRGWLDVDNALLPVAVMNEYAC